MLNGSHQITIKITIPLLLLRLSSIPAYKFAQTSKRNTSQMAIDFCNNRWKKLLIFSLSRSTSLSRFCVCFFFVLATCWTPAFSTNYNYKETRSLSYLCMLVVLFFFSSHLRSNVLLNFDTWSWKYARMHTGTHKQPATYMYSKWSTLANLESIYWTHHHHTSSILIFYYMPHLSLVQFTLNGVLQLIQLDFFSTA